MKIVKIIITGVLLLSFSANATDKKVYPSLLEVQIGTIFSHPRATENKDINRPTTQFRVPNYGVTSEVYPEYEVAYLNSSNSVVIVTANITTEGIKECLALKNRVLSLVKEKYPNHKSTPYQNSQLKSDKEYSEPGNNTYYVLNCQRRYGPFHTLHLQVRGIKEDAILKKAWGKFFASETH